MRSSGGRNRKQQQTVSASTMSRALLLLSIATSANAFTSCSSTIHQQSNSALQYRYGNDDNQPIDMKQFNINSSAMRRRRRSHLMSSSRRPSTTPSPPPTQKPTMELEQEMDEYIEYLDRRYTRMHPKRSSTKIVYTYFNLQGKILSSLLPSPTTSSGSSNNRDDTIKILGLSGLASKRLRQRLSDKIISSIRSICNFFSLNIIPELVATKTGGFSMASLTMLLLIRPLLSTFRQS